MALTVEQISVNSACYKTIPPGDRMAAVLYLVDQILAAGGGGGGSSLQLVTYTSGSPAAPPNTSQPAIAYDPTGILPTLGWNTSTLAWV